MIITTTKKGLKLWGSGIIVVLMEAAFMFMMTDGVIEGMSLWETASVFLVLFPLVIGWVQRWYWSESGDDDAESEWIGK